MMWLHFAPHGVDTGPFAVTIGDFNGDGKLDLATANQIARTVSVLIGTGSGTLSRPPPTCWRRSVNPIKPSVPWGSRPAT